MSYHYMKYYYNGITSDTLYHHGILGQKWGKKNGPPYPLDEGDHSIKEVKDGWKKSLGSGRNEHLYDRQSNSIEKPKRKIYTKEQIDKHRDKLVDYYRYKDRKQYLYYRVASDDDIAKDLQNKEQVKKALIAGAAVVGISAAVYLAYKYDIINKIKNQKNTSEKETLNIFKGATDDIEFVLGEGSTIHRMEGLSGLDITKKDEASYMAFDPDDVKRYRSLLRDWHGTGQRFDTSYKTTKDIKVPTEKTARKIFSELYDDPKFKNQLTEDLASCLQHAYKASGHNLSRSEAISAAKGHLYQDYFGMGIYSLVGKGESSKTYFSALQKAGFDAIIDYFDAGSLGEKPLIMIDPNGSLTKTGERLVSGFEQILTAQYLMRSGKIL